ncbi:MAG: hypothetical protein NTY53_25290 [Kiritimatiellaeota bacterium]|nr:hypothetical protein [Kiritimatiellota bacterium]
MNAQDERDASEGQRLKPGDYATALKGVRLFRREEQGLVATVWEYQVTHAFDADSARRVLTELPDGLEISCFAPTEKTEPGFVYFRRVNDRLMTCRGGHGWKSEPKEETLENAVQLLLASPLVKVPDQRFESFRVIEGNCRQHPNPTRRGVQWPMSGFKATNADGSAFDVRREKKEESIPDKRNFAARLFIPRYNELVLYLMSLAFVLVFFTDGKLKAEIFDKFKFYDPREYIFMFLISTGILLSLFHGLTNLPMSSLEKFPMFFFAVIVSGGSGIAAGMHMWKESSGLLLVFPVWNIINGAVLLILFRLRVITPDVIVDEPVRPLQILLGSIVVISTFLVCRFLFAMYWAITFSICVAYATNIDATVQDLFARFKRLHQRG